MDGPEQGRVALMRSKVALPRVRLARFVGTKRAEQPGFVGI